MGRDPRVKGAVESCGHFPRDIVRAFTPPPAFPADTGGHNTAKPIREAAMVTYEPDREPEPAEQEPEAPETMPEEPETMPEEAEGVTAPEPGMLPEEPDVTVPEPEPERS